MITGLKAVNELCNEICDVPEFKQNGIEECIIKILSSIGVNVKNYDIVAAYGRGNQHCKLHSLMAMMKRQKKCYKVFSILILVSLFFWYVMLPETVYTPYEYKKVYSKKWTYGDGSCSLDRPNRSMYVELLQEWVGLAEKLNISYFLTKGSLLSTVRDGELFPWDPDNDMDLLMRYEDMARLEPYQKERPVELFTDNKVRVIIQKDWRLEPKYRRYLMCNDTEVPVYTGICGFRWLLARMVKGTAYIDIYQYKIIRNRLVDIWNAYPVRSVFPLQKCVFLNVTMKCPLTPFNILHKHYGSSLEPEMKCLENEWIKKGWFDWLKKKHLFT